MNESTLNEDGLSEGLGPLAQPSNDVLRDALAAARQEADSGWMENKYCDEAKQTLWALRERRSTWFDADELGLRKEIDDFFGRGTWHEIWITNSQHWLCDQYGATVFGDRSPGGHGCVRATWTDGAEIRFHYTTPLSELREKLVALRNRGSIDDDLRDMLTAACGPTCVN